MEKRAGAAEHIALTLSPAEAAMLEAVPEAQLHAIVANTKVSPGLRPAFLGCAAAAMLAALGASAYAADTGSNDGIITSTGIRGEPPAETADTVGDDVPIGEYATLLGAVTDENGDPVSGAIVKIGISKLSTITDKNGNYKIRFVVVPGVEYSITASHDDYETKTETGVEVIPGSETNVSFNLVSVRKDYEYVPSEYPLITGIMPDHPSKKGE
jgi:hypothetical protein